MNLKTALFLILASAPACFGQYQCTSSTAVVSQSANTGQSCSPVTTPAGNEVVALNQSGNVTSQMICDTTTTPGSSTYCPAGYLRYDITAEPVGTSALAAVQVLMSFTTDVRTYTNQTIGGSISLLSPVITYVPFGAYHVAGTAVTLTTTVANLGTATYNLRARSLVIGNN